MKYFVMTYDLFNDEYLFYAKDKQTGQFLFENLLSEECITAFDNKLRRFKLTKLNNNLRDIECFTVPFVVGLLINFWHLLKIKINRFFWGKL